MVAMTDYFRCDQKAAVEMIIAFVCAGFLECYAVVPDLDRLDMALSVATGSRGVSC